MRACFRITTNKSTNLLPVPETANAKNAQNLRLCRTGCGAPAAATANADSAIMIHPEAAARADTPIVTAEETLITMAEAPLIAMAEDTLIVTAEETLEGEREKEGALLMIMAAKGLDDDRAQTCW